MMELGASKALTQEHFSAIDASLAGVEKPSGSEKPSLTEEQQSTLNKFRNQLRGFLNFSEVGAIHMK